MKTTERIITRIMVMMVMLTASLVWAGDLTPPGAPGSTMHSLEEIYQKVSWISTNVVSVVVQTNVQEEAIKTGGNFQSTDLVCSIPSGFPGDWSVHDFSWPIPVSLLSVSWLDGTEYDGDNFQIAITPDSVIGVLTENASIGDTQFSVSSTVVSNAPLGYWISISDGVNKQDLGRLISKTASTIAVETPLANNFSASTPTYIMTTVKMVENRVLKGAGNVTEIGGSKVGGTYLPASSVYRILYQNNQGLDKSFCLSVDLLY